MAHQDDLFEHLTKQAKEDGTLPNGYSVKEIMDSWTLQPGFPLIRVFNVGNNKIYVSQVNYYLHTLNSDSFEHIKDIF